MKEPISPHEFRYLVCIPDEDAAELYLFLYEVV